MPRAKKSPIPEAEDLKPRILEAALRNFAAHGFSSASLRAIAAEVGATAPMINYYFGSKGELYAYLLTHTIEALRARVAALVGEPADLSTTLVQLGSAYLTFAAESPHELRLYFRAALAPNDAPEGFSVEEIRAEGFRDVRRVIESGSVRGGFRLRAGISVDDVVAHVVATMEYVVLRALTGDFPIAPDRLAAAHDELARMFGVVLRGVEDGGGR